MVGDCVGFVPSFISVSVSLRFLNFFLFVLYILSFVLLIKPEMTIGIMINMAYSHTLSLYRLNVVLISEIQNIGTESSLHGV